MTTTAQPPKPWAHQVKALEFIRDKPGAMLALEMGCGKTKVAINHMEDLDAGTDKAKVPHHILHRTGRRAGAVALSRRRLTGPVDQFPGLGSHPLGSDVEFLVKHPEGGRRAVAGHAHRDPVQPDIPFPSFGGSRFYGNPGPQ
jgi:hypothetical protein